MKLLIDISEHIYEHAKETTEDSRDEFDAMRAIANGTQQESRSEIPNTCGDAVSREAVIEWLADRTEIYDEMGNFVSADKVRKKCEDMISELPSVTPQQRTGRWIKQNYGWNWQCSECGFVTPPSAKEIFTFCPNCGAKMEAENAD